MDDTSAKVARLFEALAADYDRSGVDFFEPIAAGLVAEVAPRPAERILDVGCGAGAVLLPTAELVGTDGEVVGVDIAEAMVVRTREAAAARGLGWARALVGDAAAPPVEGVFDAVMSSLVLFFLADPAAALRSWRPLLASGGRLGVATFGPWDPRLEEVEQVLEEWIPPQMRDPRTTEDDSPFETDEGMEALVAGAGYDDVRTASRTLPVRFADFDAWYAFSWSTGQRGMWLAVPEERRDDVRAEAARRFATYAEPDGSLTAGVGIRYTLATAPR